MSKGGHLLTAAALAYAIYERSASPTLAFGTLLGSSFPDIGEFARFRGRWRTSLIPHRTLTHWIPLYIAVIIALPHLALGLPWWTLQLINGVCFGSILHVVLDLFSPAGIPIINPFGTRVSLGFHRRSTGKPCLYRTGTIEELPVVAITVATIVFFVGPSSAPFSLGTFATQSLDLFGSLVRTLEAIALTALRDAGIPLR